MEPALSILSPAYRCAKFLGCMIESVQAQTYADWELIIVDDGSDDGTLDVARQYARRDSRIRTSQIPHGGHSVALNACIALARGRLIGRQDADDWSNPARFQTQIDLLQQEEADLCSCLMVRVRRRGRCILGREQGGSGMIPIDFCTNEATKGPATATIICKRGVYDKVGPFRTDVPGHLMGSTDSDWLFRILLVDNPPYKWCHVHDELYHYRDHPNQATKRFAKLGRNDHAMFRDQYAPKILERLKRCAQ